MQNTPRNEFNNQLFLALSIFVYMDVVCHLCCQEKGGRKSKISLIFNDTCSFCTYSLYRCKIHQEMNSTTNWLFLALSFIVYMVAVCHFAFVRQKAQEKAELINFQLNMLILHIFTAYMQNRPRNELNNQQAVYGALLNFYMVVVGYFESVKQKTQEKTFLINFQWNMLILHVLTAYMQNTPRNEFNNQLDFSVTVKDCLATWLFFDILHLSSKSHKKKQISFFFNETCSFCTHSLHNLEAGCCFLFCLWC